MEQSSSNHGPKEQCFIASVLFAEIAGYNDYLVFEQIQYSTQMRQLLERAVARANSHDLLIIDREESVVLVFPGDPTDCFRLARQLSEILAADESCLDLPLRVGVNLGPVTLSRNELSVPQVSGTGVEDAARAAQAGLLREVLISRSYYAVFARISKEYGLLQYREFISDDFDESFAIYQIAPPTTSPVTPRVSHSPSLDALAPIAGRGLRWRYAAVSALVAAGAFAMFQSPRSDMQPTIHPSATTASKVESVAKRDVLPTETAATVAAEPILVAENAAASAEQSSEPAEASAEQLSEPPAPAAEIVAAVDFHHAIPSSASPGPIVRRPPPVKRVVRAAAVTTATVSLAIKPWGEIYVDGKKVGVTPPLRKIKVPSGKRKITVRNANFLPYHATIDVQPKSLLQISHRFD